MMKVLLVGGTGMVGQGVLRECLQDPSVQVLSVGRTPLGKTHERLTERVVSNLHDAELGWAMLRVVREKPALRVLEAQDIVRLGRSP
jgi:saccharopine dehydrogenase-like NADP-dependent oxidoreductase